MCCEGEKGCKHACMYEYACLLASRNVCIYAQYRDIETCGLTLHKEEGKNDSKKM